MKRFKITAFISLGILFSLVALSVSKKRRRHSKKELFYDDSLNVISKTSESIYSETGVFF